MSYTDADAAPARETTAKNPVNIARIRKLMKLRDIDSMAELDRRVRAQTADLPTTAVRGYLNGTWATFNPLRHKDYWHPIPRAIAQVLDDHVSRLFPVPEEWKQRPSFWRTEEEERILNKRIRIQRMAAAAGYESLAELARTAFDKFPPERLENLISEQSRNGQLKVAGETNWGKAEETLAAMLRKSPVDVFGLPLDVQAELDEAILRHRDRSPAQQFDELAYLSGSSSAQEKPDAPLLRAESYKIMRRAFEALTPRENVVLKLRFGFCAEEREWDLKEVAARLSISVQRVHQIEQAALTKLEKRIRTIEESLPTVSLP